jgi:hypothetical protein
VIFCAQELALFRAALRALAERATLKLNLGRENSTQCERLTLRHSKSKLKNKTRFITPSLQLNPPLVQRIAQALEVRAADDQQKRYVGLPASLKWIAWATPL